MKYLILFMFLLGCSPHFKKGDCAVNGNYELLKIIQVGSNDGYEVQKRSCEIGNWHSMAGGLAKTDCFDSFKHCEKVKK